MLKKIRSARKKLHEYNNIAGIAEIGRRYFAMNSFDGILTIMGMLIGQYMAHINDPHIIITTGFAASIAMGISGTWGTYLTEEAERKKKLKELGQHTLRELHTTKIARAEKVATLIVSLIDGLSPFAAAFIVILPFFFVPSILINTAFFISFAIAFLLLILLGGYLGHISQENIFINGGKMAFAGVVCVIFVLLLEAPV